MIYTIGHSNHPIERFISLLRGHGIDAVADVRSTPYSRFNPQFRRDPLAASLADAGIRYVFLGEELGARSRDPSCYDGNRVSYAKLARSALFQRGLERLISGEREFRVAIMCAEKEPLECHRTILVTRELERRGVPATHILADGTLEPNSQTIARLVADMKLGETDLFRTEHELIEEAYDARSEKVAYVKP